MKAVITGMGAVSPLGRGAEDLWEGLVEGRQGLKKISLFETKGLRNGLAGEIEGYPPERSETRAVRMLIDACREAVDSSGAKPSETGVLVGTNFGGMSAAERALHGGESVLGLYDFTHALDAVRSSLDLEGPGAVVSLSCASGAVVLGVAFAWIRAGRAKAVLCAGYDELSLYSIAGLSALHAISADTIRPFDKERSGTIFSEGAGALVAEEMDHARARGADILCEILGYSVNQDAFHMTAPEKEGRGITRLMREALKDARVSPDGIDHINAHATATKYNDLIESTAIAHVFGERGKEIPLAANKSQLGHTMGAAGSLEAIAAVKTLLTGIVPPVSNLREQDPECPVNISTEAREAKVRTVMKNSYGIGGTNCSLVLRRL